MTIGIVLLACQISNAQTDGIKKYDPRFNPETNCMTRFFYYPNIEAYFDTKENVYLFTDKGEWKKAAELPHGYRGYSLNNKINVPIKDYDEDNITQFLAAHKKKFPYVSSRRLPVTAMVQE